MYTWSPVTNGSYFRTVTQPCSGNALVSLYFLTNCHEQFIDTKTEIVLSCQAERWSNSLWCVVASRLYICLYVYPSHSTRDTLIVQLAAVRGHHTPTEIYTSPSLATNRFAISPHSCLLHSALPLLNSSRSPSLSYHALFHMHSEAVCILNVWMYALFHNVLVFKYPLTAMMFMTCYISLFSCKVLWRLSANCKRTEEVWRNIVQKDKGCSWLVDSVCWISISYGCLTVWMWWM